MKSQPNADDSHWDEAIAACAKSDHVSLPELLDIVMDLTRAVHGVRYHPRQNEQIVKYTLEELDRRHLYRSNHHEEARMNRREFAITAGTVGLVGTMPACWIGGDIYKHISTYVPVALLAFDRITSILVEHGVDVSGLTEAINRVKAALADIQTSVLEFHDAAQHEKETLIHAIAVALKIATERLLEFWELLKIPNRQLAMTIKMLLDVIISTLTGFVGQLAPSTPVATQRFVSEPKMRTLKQFREDFNRVLAAAGESKYAI